MKKKYYELVLFGRTWRVELRKGEYMMGGLAVEMITDEGEDFETLTVCLGAGTGNNKAFIDTNNCPWAEDFLLENGIAREVGVTRSSGYCTYPLYEFYGKVLEEMQGL